MAPQDPQWLRPRQVRKDLWSISDPGMVNSWLLLGSERSLLVDTGCGIEPIRPIVEEISPAPVVVVNTHHHIDHVGGNREFEDVRIHSSGAELLGSRPHPALVTGMLEWLRSSSEAVAERGEDDLVLALVEPESVPPPLPADVAERPLDAPPGPPSSTLEEGDVIELGDRELRVLHTPGHSADCICLLEPEWGLLFAGDTLDPVDLLVQYSDSSLEHYIASVRRLAGLEQSLELLLLSHSGHANAELTLIAEAEQALAAVAAGVAESVETVDWTGGRVLEARVGRLAVQVTPPDGPPVRSVIGDGDADS